MGGATVSRRSTIGSSPNPTSVPPSSYYHPPPLGPGRSPQLPSRYHHNLHDNNMGSHMHRSEFVHVHVLHVLATCKLLRYSTSVHTVDVLVHMFVICERHTLYMYTKCLLMLYLLYDYVC